MNKLKNLVSACVADVYCNYKDGTQDEKGAAAKDTTATDEWYSKVEGELTWSSEEVLLTWFTVVYLCC